MLELVECVVEVGDEELDWISRFSEIDALKHTKH